MCQVFSEVLRAMISYMILKILKVSAIYLAVNSSILVTFGRCKNDKVENYIGAFNLHLAFKI